LAVDACEKNRGKGLTARSKDFEGETERGAHVAVHVSWKKGARDWKPGAVEKRVSCGDASVWSTQKHQTKKKNGMPR